MDNRFCFAIDRGGTFTDVYARCPNGKVVVLKLLSEDPLHYKDAPTEGIRRILEMESSYKPKIGEQIDTSEIGWIRMGTTVATNALLERKGERMALAITKGFKSLLHIGNQNRPNIFDLKVDCPNVLYEDVIEIAERIIPQQNVSEAEAIGNNWDCVMGVTKEPLIVTERINEEEVEKDLKEVFQKGITSLAVLLIHSYMYPAHELVVKRIAEKIGFKNVSLSCVIMPMVKAVPRGYTACSDAYLTPHIKEYLQGFKSGFINDLKDVNVLFMRSDGGLTPMNSFSGSRAILSGPAGGVVGYSMTTCKYTDDLPIIGFDMGGTSTDISRFAGKYEHVFESTTAGVTIQVPQLDINTVAAGGGSRLFFRSGMFVVGPESAGAHPGPVCYKKGGPLAVTDCNLVLGRLLPEYFPKIFGPKENEALDVEATVNAFQEITREINTHESKDQKNLSLEEVSLGFIRVANETMCRPIRALTQAKGYDTSQHVLAVFGGAGGQHACAIARSLGMRKIFIHKYAGILSAFGMALADVVHEAQEPCAKIYEKGNYTFICERISVLEEECVKKLSSLGFPRDRIICEPFLNLRYDGTDFALMCSPSTDPPLDGGGLIGTYGNFHKAFLDRYSREFGFTINMRNIIVDDIRVRGVGKTLTEKFPTMESSTGNPKPQKTFKVYFDDGYEDTDIFLLSNLTNGDEIAGPAIIIDKLSTILVEPRCTAVITAEGDIMIHLGKERKKDVGTEFDSIQLSIFSHRFMSIAEQMGRILQRTSISTNIKERLDFSCALFGPDGGLVSNAPHIPVHLGAMQEAVQYQLRTLGREIKPGDVILSNHPSAGGSHLPDLTVITPVFRKDVTDPVFYVASRGHHADIGGVTPGSMPPNSTTIYQEGAIFMSFKLVEGGIFQEEKLTEMLMAPGEYPGSSGTRNLQDNISDLRAQVAANHKGIQLVNELIDYYGLDVVQAYMTYIQSSAETAVREFLKEVGKETKKRVGKAELFSMDKMDDGTVIKLRVQIDEREGTALFDFSGTGLEVMGNCNAPRAITISALIYCLRSMVGYDIPLNQGCLRPTEVILPEGTILNPSPEAAVVGGNIQTSQRVVDVILKAFYVCAASQGCMNNITFGDQTIGYYETVAGGAGAGISWNGRSGVHTHMTNTRITDPEILEKRYPVILNKFTLSPNTGGRGKYRGGDGVIRELTFRRPLTVCILSERRVFAPYGLDGGEDGRCGENLLIRANGKMIRVPSKASFEVNKGDMFRLQTPGGGGYGPYCRKRNCEDDDQPPELVLKWFPPVPPNYCITRTRGSVFEYLKSQESS